MVLDHIINDLFDYATNEQAMKSVNKALKEGGQDMLDRMVKRLSEPARGGRRAMIVDLALSGIGAQLIGTVLPNVSLTLLCVSARH
jgi:pumilio RNA-binding family